MPPSKLAQVLSQMRGRIERGSRSLNEQNTKATLIEPVLAALGWEVQDVAEVVREHRAPRGKPVDYALLVLGEPKLYVEAKGLGENLADSKVAIQIMGYASVAGVEWIVVTNGDEWRIYNSHAAVPFADKLLRTVRISDVTGGAEEILGLLSKDQLRTKQIDALWNAQFVDHKVKAALNRFFDPRHDGALVKHVRKTAKGLTTRDIRGSMRRCNFSLEFMFAPGDLAKGKRPKAPRRSGITSSVTLLDLIKAGLLKPPLKLTASHKRCEVEARVLADGSVEFGGKAFTSLSKAGSAALGSLGARQKSGMERAVNGWDFWKYRAADGTVGVIDRARKGFLDRGGAASAG